MSLLDKNILDYYLKYSYKTFRIWIYDEKGNKLGRFTSGYSNKLFDSDKSVILNVKMTGWKKILFKGERKIYDSSENLIGSINILEHSHMSLHLSLKDKNGNEVLFGGHSKGTTPYNIYDNHKNVIAQITVIGEIPFQDWYLRVLEPSYDRALLLCLFCIVFVESVNAQFVPI